MKAYNKELLRIKKKTSIKELCKGLPSCFPAYFTYLESLGFDVKPDYEYLRNVFDECFYEYKFEDDNEYDWVR